MEEKDQNSQEFDLEDILKEFGGEPAAPDEESEAFAPPAEEPLQEPAAEEPAAEEDIPAEEPAEAPAEEEPVPTEEPQPEAEDVAEVEDAEESAEPASAVTGDTVRLDDISQAVEAMEAQAEESGDEEPQETAKETEEEGEEQPQEDAAASFEPVEEIIPPAPIPFRTPRSRLRELKKKLIAGPEKRYYELSEIGLGRLQIAIFLNIAIVLLCVAGTAMYAWNMVPENRIRLMVFSQVLAMLVSALLGSHCMIDGVADLFKGRFSLNIMMIISFIACCADAVFCLIELRVPCCAAFCLEMTMALWNRYQLRNTEMGQMDTMRKAVRLDSVVKREDFFEGRPGLLRGEGQVDDFMDNYNAVSGPEKVRNLYAIISLLACAGIAVLAGVLHSSLSLGVQIFSTSLLVAIPASFFVALSRPMAVLERRLHMVGTVLCGWQGVKGLCGRAVFPLSDEDIFPVGSTKLNGVKFYGDRKPDQVIAYAAALIRRSGGGLDPVFTQLRESRECEEYDVENFQNYGGGGIGGEVCEEPVLLGTTDFLRDMGVEIPEGTMVSQAVYCAIDGQLCAVFAISYTKMRSAAAGLVTLCGYRKLTPVLTCGDFMITESFLRGKFGVNTRRIAFPDREVRQELAEKKPEEESVALALTTKDGLAPAAYAVTGARAVRVASVLGVVIHMIGGILGMLIMLVLAYLGSAELLTPVNILLYQLVWMIPGLLITEWTRTV